MGKFAKTQILGWKLGWKVKLKVTGGQPEIFQGRTGFLEQKHLDKHFMHDIQKKGSSAGKNFLVFSSRYSLNCISSENLTLKCTQTGQFFPILEYFLPNFKKDRENLPPFPFLVALQSYFFFLKRGWYRTNFSSRQCSNSAKINFRL